jgi:uridine kinase
MRRGAFLDSLVELLPKPGRAERVIIGIDGRDGVGKTSLGDELAARLSASEHVARASLDGFHHPRAHRHRRGQTSGESYWQEAFDTESAVRHLLEPWRTGRGPWRPAIHDVVSDERLELPGAPVPRAGVLIVDGVFLARPELIRFWTTLILLDAPLVVSQARAAARDGHLPPASGSSDRYAAAHALYRSACNPESRADIVIDATSLDEPRIIRASHG